MSFDKYLEVMKKIQVNVLDFLMYEIDIEEKFQNLKDIFSNIQIYDNKYVITSILHLLVEISNNMHREINFFSKIEQILLIFKEKIIKYFTNIEIFNIFGSNKRILLFLLEENIIHMDKFIVKRIITGKFLHSKYPQYFSPEIQPFLNEILLTLNENIYEEEENLISQIKKELPEDFYENRRIGENDNLICKLIQKDLIEDFIIYVNKNMYSLNALIDESIYETNSFLLKNKNVSLIEYAVFCGSNQIFKYLRSNDAKITASIWIYAIHGQNAEIIRFLEENYVYLLEDGDFEKLFIESIKCHHVDVSNYIRNNYLTDEIENSNNTMICSLKYYNFEFIQKKFIDFSFNYLCKYDYSLLVIFLLKKVNININNTNI